jgi:superfamily II DNA/RNA helicase
MPFADLGLSDDLLRAIGDSGYNEPTPIQAGAIPPVLMGKDLIGIAQTGTGKTAAFVLPMIDVLGEGRSRARMPRSLILEPTRELAAQVAENFEKYGKYHKLSMALLIGGVQMGDQIKSLEKGVDVLIATPGRLMDLFQRGKILLTGCDLLVIDEADRMLDMGFIPDIEEICTKLPKQRQTLLFSATMPAPIQKLAAKFLTDPRRIEVARPASANLNIEARLVETRGDKKREALRDLLRAEDVSTAIIFCNRKTTVRELTTSLKRSGFAVGQIHGDMEQPARLAELDRFKGGEINILVASDVAARGLDIKGVSHVFNFDVPWQPDDYVHRVGRTGRAGAKGKAFTLATREDSEAVAQIEKLTGTPIQRVASVASSEPNDEAAAAESKPDRAKRSGARGSREGAPTAPPRGRRTREQEVTGEVVAAPAAKQPEREARRSDGKSSQASSGGNRDRVDNESRRERNPAPSPAPRRTEPAGEEGWNGPLPSFLSVGVGS